ncbi:hypothetical protein G7K_5254-t1 [Saitoella complicata NRRL Y-17804]|uniref:Uncharacterized protein n=1 Tax=Saitoella complicata (strain BCRC 22490 / CBS 7301 / JCM 7358 / NBRC 10748 / NRRL Y-17804) TaxID=698492 RepID=A0A0E9NMW3_SAICN|nr:hypothetical protein G7K_5254-t1 [Saitoella complicata NRRL Y-17804]
MDILRAGNPTSPPHQLPHHVLFCLPRVLTRRLKTLIMDRFKYTLIPPLRPTPSRSSQVLGLTPSRFNTLHARYMRRYMSCWTLLDLCYPRVGSVALR